MASLLGRRISKHGFQSLCGHFPDSVWSCEGLWTPGDALSEGCRDAGTFSFGFAFVDCNRVLQTLMEAGHRCGFPSCPELPPGTIAVRDCPMDVMCQA